MKKIVAFVPIKLNSERLPHKNILPLNGHPLCWHIIHTLLQVNTIEEVYIYCSDNNIQNYVPSNAIFLKREKRLDGNGIKGLEIYQKFIEEIDADIYVLAHTTSPFISKQAIEHSLKMVISGAYDSAFSAQKIQTFAWFQGKPINYLFNDIPKTQDLEPIYIETSGFFIFKKEVLLKHNRRIGFNPYIQEVNSIEAIDIDTEDDYMFAKKLGGKDE